MKLERGTMNSEFCSEFIVLSSSFQWAGVAQLVEHQPSKLRVASSNLVARSSFSLTNG